MLAATMPVAAAHARPRAVAVVTMTSLLVATGLGYPTGVAALAALIALGVAAAIVDRRTALALAAAVSVLAVLLTSPGHHPRDRLFPTSRLSRSWCSSGSLNCHPPP